MEHKIPSDVRTAVLSRLEDRGLQLTALSLEFFQREGYGSFDDFISASPTVTTRRPLMICARPSSSKA